MQTYLNMKFSVGVLELNLVIKGFGIFLVTVLAL
jgi:hypothetical protein